MVSPQIDIVARASRDKSDSALSFFGGFFYFTLLAPRKRERAAVFPITDPPPRGNCATR